MNARRSALIAGFLIVVLFVAGTAHAQGKTPNGIAMGYPAAVGVLWNVSDRVAVWPELTSFRHDSTSTSSAQGDTTTIGVGVRVLFYLAPPAAFRPYFVPQFDYFHANTTATIAIGGSSAAGPSSTASASLAAGSFGAQYALSSRFGVFGEVGLEYQRQTLTGLSDTHTNTVATRSAVGVIVFF